IIGLGRQVLSRDEYLNKIKEGCGKFITSQHFSEEAFQTFAQRLDYVSIDANSPGDFEKLASYLKDSPAQVRVFYLSTGPDLFVTICNNLARAGLVHEQSRVVLEKPLG